MALATPIAVQSLVNTIAFGTLLQPLVVLVLILFASLGLNNLLIAFQFYVVEMIQRRIFVRLLGNITNRLERVTSEALDDGNGPELVNRFFDVMTVQKTAAVLLLDGLAYGLQAAIGMLLLAFYHPILLAFDLLLILAVLFVFFVLGRRGVSTSIEESKAKYAAAAWLEEISRNFKMLKWAGEPSFIREKSNRLAYEYLNARADHFGVVIRQHVGILFLHTLANTTLLGLGGWMVIERQLTLGQLIAAELVVNAMIGGLSRLGKSLESYYDLLAAMDKLGYLLDLQQESTEGEILKKSDGPIALSLHKLSFQFGKNRKIKLGPDLEANPGERIALLGTSGSGRGTLLELIFGLRSPSSGSIQLDGIDIRSIQLDSIRRKAALVKSVEIMEGSILDNIRMGRPEITIEEISEILSGLKLADDIMALADGLNTRLNYLGSPLSPEKTRRLLLARALAGKPRLLLIYEILDTLDSSVQQNVIDWILREDAPWTAIVATQSEAVISRCTKIWRLETEALVET